MTAKLLARHVFDTGVSDHRKRPIGYIAEIYRDEDGELFTYLQQARMRDAGKGWVSYGASQRGVPHNTLDGAVAFLIQRFTAGRDRVIAQYGVSPLTARPLDVERSLGESDLRNQLRS